MASTFANDSLLRRQFSEHSDAEWICIRGFRVQSMHVSLRVGPSEKALDKHLSAQNKSATVSSFESPNLQEPRPRLKHVTDKFVPSQLQRAGSPVEALPEILG